MGSNFIDVYEFQKIILKYIGSNEIDKMIDSTVFKDDQKCKQAIIHGMVMAAILTSRCKLYRIMDEEG